MKRNRNKIDLFIVTGMSGAGKSQALKCLEDLGFFCVDNLPTTLIPKFIEISERSERLRKVALGIDIREGEFLDAFLSSFNQLKQGDTRFRIVFLDATDSILIRRFSETRRRHPLGGTVSNGIKRERKKLSEIRAYADKIIDTSELTLGELKETIAELLKVERTEEIRLNLVSFGYKYGLPSDADIVFDVRFLPNPNYIPQLKPYTGENDTVAQYVLDNPRTQSFTRQLFPLITSLIPYYVAEGKSYLTIAIGCTGGKHRAVVITNALNKFLREQNFNPNVQHRDIHK